MPGKYFNIRFGPLEIVLVALIVTLLFGIARLPAIAAMISRFISAMIAKVRNYISYTLLSEEPKKQNPKAEEEKILRT